MIRVVVTDLDGTLLRSDGKFNPDDIDSLVKLGDRGVTRVIATGRSPYSASKVIPDDFPIDYLIFSSGAGIIRWCDKSIIHTNELSAGRVQEVISLLIEMKADFMVHEPIPLNHCFHYYDTGNNNPDFLRRIELYREFCQPLIVGVPFPGPASQVLTVLPSNIHRYISIAERINGLQVIRATSPLDGESIWLEIFPEGVSKAGGLSWLCCHLGDIPPEEVAALGNDYNDLDMLSFAGKAFVVSNAPQELRKSFINVTDNNSSGFTQMTKLATGG